MIRIMAVPLESINMSCVLKSSPDSGEFDCERVADVAEGTMSEIDTSIIEDSRMLIAPSLNLRLTFP